MSVQWFPGHMHAARRKAAESMGGVDMVIEVLDARLPQASCNPMVKALRLSRQKPCLRLLNKSDLADPVVTREWIEWWGGNDDALAVAVSLKNPADVMKIPDWCREVVPTRGSADRPLRMMIMGIPNVGKSTLMNALLKRRVAAVRDEPAVTQSQQRLYLNKGMVLIDTPGLLWPKIHYPDDGLMLAASHAVGVNALIEEEVAIFLAGILLARYPGLLLARYGMDFTGLDAAGVLESLAVRRGMKLKGGYPDMEKSSRTLLQDYRGGALGRISLETPLTRQAMVAVFEEKSRQDSECSL